MNICRESSQSICIGRGMRVSEAVLVVHCVDSGDILLQSLHVARNEMLCKAEPEH